MIRINGIKLQLDDSIDVLKDKIVKKLHIKESDLIEYHIVRESLDARKGISFLYSVDVRVKDESKIRVQSDITYTPSNIYTLPTMGNIPLKSRVCVVGFGPSGIFSALLLAKMGYKPLVLERGSDVDTRLVDVNQFWQEGILHPQSNVQFGEGGAGTFSDGKLTTRIKDVRVGFILKELVAYGAPESILYEASPHIGTDILSKVVKAIREDIIRLGGQVLFNHQVSDLRIENNQLYALEVNGTQWIDCHHCILAIGHSARDTFEMMVDRKVNLEQKPFAVGLRIEHPQDVINHIQYKQYANHPRLKAAEYKLTHTSSNGRGVYTFCMCPGGQVVASSSEEGCVVTNGMSYHARAEENANSAILVQVDQRDFESDHPLAGMYYQRKLEQCAFALGNKTYKAPIMLVKDLLTDTKTTSLGSITPTFSNGVVCSDFRLLFKQEIIDSLKEGLLAFDKRMPGFAMDDAVLTAVESRTSSPVRLPRDKQLQSNVQGLYPSGEGAGYAGGIMSAACDGMRVAESIIKEFSNK